VVWFGEQLDHGVLESARRAVDCDLFFTIGTSAEVHPAAGFISEASKRGALTVEINPEPTAATGTVDVVVQEPAEEFLPELTRNLP
jgi:NAD-dependent deacetylase